MSCFPYYKPELLLFCKVACATMKILLVPKQEHGGFAIYQGCHQA